MKLPYSEEDLQDALDKKRFAYYWEMMEWNSRMKLRAIKNDLQTWKQSASAWSDFAIRMMKERDEARREARKWYEKAISNTVDEYEYIICDCMGSRTGEHDKNCPMYILEGQDT